MTTTVAPLTSDDIEALMIVETILGLRAEKLRVPLPPGTATPLIFGAAATAYSEAVLLLRAARNGDTEALLAAAREDADFTVRGDGDELDDLTLLVHVCARLIQQGAPRAALDTLLDALYDEPSSSPANPGMNRQQRRAAARKKGR
jgi:hypothetical protein